MSLPNIQKTIKVIILDSKPANVALLIDTDNSPAKYVDAVVTKLQRHGETNIKRAYGNWKKPTMQSWEERLHQHAIQPIQQFDLTPGKKCHRYCDCD